MQLTHPDLYPSARSRLDYKPQYGHLIGIRWQDGGGAPIAVTAPATGRGLMQAFAALVLAHYYG